MKLKKLLAILSGAVALILALLVCAACGNETVKVTLAESGEKLVVIKADKTGGSLEDALQALRERGELTYTDEEGPYGSYIVSVNGYAADSAKNEFWAIYTSLGTYDGVVYSSTEYGSFEYDGASLGSASYGASGLPLIEGGIYVLTISSY